VAEGTGGRAKAEYSRLTGCPEKEGNACAVKVLAEIAFV